MNHKQGVYDGTSSGEAYPLFPGNRKLPPYGELAMPRRWTYGLKKYDYGVEGYDTETEDGYARIIADSRGYAEVDSLDDCLAFLCRHQARNRHNFFYNLRYDVAAIAKHDGKFTRSLFIDGAADYKGWALRYIPKKLLTVRTPDRNVYSFTDVAQFYMSSLEKAAEGYLGEKVHELKAARASLFTDFTSKEIGAYCQHDAGLTRKLGELHMQSLGRLGLYPKRCISGANLAEIFVRQNADVPVLFDVPRVVAEWYYKAYRGGWFEMFKRGRFRAWQYDIVSAYPMVLRGLPDLRRGAWGRGIHERACCGVCKVILNTSRTGCPPLACYRPSMLAYPDIDTPCVTHVTLGEYEALKDVYSMELLDAWTFVPGEGCGYPFRECVDKLFALKQALKGEPGRYNAVKITLNSIYGKTFQKTLMPDGKTRVGRLFNPVYAAEITAQTRLMLWDVVRKNEDTVIGVATDSIISTTPLSVGVGEGIGLWSLEKEREKLIVVMNGVYQFYGEVGKLRGSPMKKGRSLNYALPAKELRTTSMRPLTPKEAIIRGDTGLVNRFVDVPYELGLRNHRRLELEEPETFRDLLDRHYDSIPMPLSVVYWMDSPEHGGRAQAVREAMPGPSFSAPALSLCR
jgi:hypothetical protein